MTRPSTVLTIITLGLSLGMGHAVHAEPPKNYEAVPRKLAKSVTASSAADGHGAERLRDGRVGTAWRSGPGEAVGVTVEITYSSPRHVAWVTLLPGLGADPDAFASTARPSEVTLFWEGGEQRFVLDDARKWQDLPIKGLARVTTLKIRIDAVVGPADAGVAISEIAAYEPYEIITVKKRQRNRMTDAVQALRDPDAVDAVKGVVRFGERIIPWLIAEVDRGEILSGVRAFEALKGVDRKRAWRVAFRVLGQGAPDSVVVAARFVAKEGANDLADVVYDAYGRMSGEPRLQVLGAMASLRDPRALKVLMDGIRAGDAALIAAAGEHLGSYGDDAMFELVALAGDPDKVTRDRAVSALIALGGPVALQTLCDLANGPDGGAGALVVTALTQSEALVARAALIHLASQVPGAIRDAALDGVISSGSQVLQALVMHASQADAATSARVSDALGRARSAEVRSALAESVLGAGERPNPHILRALGSHGKDGVQVVLETIVADPGRAGSARTFLMKTYARSAPVLAAALSNLSPGSALDPVRTVILKVVAHAQYVRAAELVAGVFRAPTSSKAIRLVALETLAVLPAKVSRDVAREALAHADDELSQAGLEAAIRLGDEEAGNILVGRLTSARVEDWTMASIEALAKLRTKAAVAAFRKAIWGATKELQLAMLRAAKRIGGKDATRFLVETSMAGEAEVSRTASQLLRSR